MKPTAIVILACILLMGAIPCFAEGPVAAAGIDESKTGLAMSVKYIAAALAVGLCALATGIAQSRIGAAGMGAIVEKPETTGTVIICIAIPETMVILGFVVAAMIIIL